MKWATKFLRQFNTQLVKGGHDQWAMSSICRAYYPADTYLLVYLPFLILLRSCRNATSLCVSVLSWHRGDAKRTLLTQKLAITKDIVHVAFWTIVNIISFIYSSYKRIQRRAANLQKQKKNNIKKVSKLRLLKTGLFILNCQSNHFIANFLLCDFFPTIFMGP